MKTLIVAITSALLACVDAATNDTDTVACEVVHYVTLELRQTSYTLSISQHIKDEANSFELTIPTTKRFYDSVRVGQKLGGKFKGMSFLISGTLGSREVKVKRKFTKVESIGTKPQMKGETK